jgi:hypothetical protein
LALVVAANQLVTQTSSHLAAYFSSLSGEPWRDRVHNPFSLGAYLQSINRRLPMRLLLSAIVAAGSLVFAAAAIAQSTAPDTTTTPATTSNAAVPVNPAAAVPVPSGKRFACQAASQGFKGQDRQDQLQLCMAQARLDCLKQAIDQKIVGPERRDFVRNCVQE